MLSIAPSFFASRYIPTIIAANPATSELPLTVAVFGLLLSNPMMSHVIGVTVKPA
jgi:hypothetical protein